MKILLIALIAVLTRAIVRYLTGVPPDNSVEGVVQRVVQNIGEPWRKSDEQRLAAWVRGVRRMEQALLGEVPEPTARDYELRARHHERRAAALRRELAALRRRAASRGRTRADPDAVERLTVGLRTPL